MNNIFIQEDGIVLAFTALVLPVILLISALMIDSGQLYVRHGEIEHLSRQSGQSGLLAFSQIIEDQATINYQNQCNIETPPSICDSINPFDFLTETDLQNLILSAANQTQVQQNALDFGTEFDPRSKLVADDFTVTYPYLYTPGESQVKILIEVETLPTLLLGTILTNTEPIKYSSIAYLSLQ